MGEKITVTSKDKCFVLIAAPGDPLNVHEQNPPTDLTIFVNRAKFSETDEQFDVRCVRRSQARTCCSDGRNGWSQAG